MNYEEVKQINNDSTLQDITIYPITDAHMHIQGNGIAPIPIMKGIIIYQLASGLCEKADNQINIKELSYITNNKVSIEEKKFDKKHNMISKVTSINFIDIDKFLFENRKAMQELLAKDITELEDSFLENNKNLASIGKILCSPIHLPFAIAKDLKIIDFLKFIIQSPKKFYDSYFKDKELKAEEDKINEELENQKRLKNEDSFMEKLIKGAVSNAVGNYGELGIFTSFDLSKIYMNSDEALSLGYLSCGTDSTIDKSNNKIKELIQEEKKTFTSSDSNDYKSFLGITSHYPIGKTNKSISSYFQFAIMHQMELMYAHYWGAAGIPIYVAANNKFYYVTNSIYEYYRSPWKLWLGKRKIPLHNIYSCGNLLNDSIKDLKKTLPKNEIKTNEKYFHILKEIEDNELNAFESFEKHIFFHKLAALKYPFRLLSFFHIDPRRFISSIDKSKHIFIEKKEEEKNEYEKLDVSEITKKQNLSEILENFFIQNNASVSSERLFWGIKMYVALGYPPYFGIDEKNTEKIFPMLSKDELNNAKTLMTNFYNYCATNKIPITCHGSPQGMTIGDPAIYFKEYLKSCDVSVPSNFPSTPVNFMKGIGLIDSFSSPKSWEIVLNKHPNLKLCIAHFGGSRFMDGTFFSEKDGSVFNSDNDCVYYNWMKDISNLINKYENVYTDLSCYSFVGNDKDSKYGFSLNKLFKYYKKEKKEEYKKYKNYSDFKKEKLELKKNDYRTYIKDIFNLIEYEGKKYKDEIEKYRRDLKEYELYENTEYCPPEPIVPKENLYAKIYFVAQNLKTLISNNEALKFRLMFGSDWPMFETSEKLGSYNAAWFLMSQYLTYILGEKWDAWHQFAVINPLKFLGLIDESKSVLDEYSYTNEGKNKLNLYRDCLENFYDAVKNKESLQKMMSNFKTLDIGKEFTSPISTLNSYININVEISSAEKKVNDLIINFGEKK